MKLVFKIAVLQVFWFAVVLLGPLWPFLIIGTSVVLSQLNYLIYRPQISYRNYVFFLCSFVVFGLFHDVSLSIFELIDYKEPTFPYWLTSLYIVFICYYGDIFNRLTQLPKVLQFLIGGGGAVLAYIGGVRLADFEILSIGFYIYVALLWGIFLTLSLKYFYRCKKTVD